MHRVGLRLGVLLAVVFFAGSASASCSKRPLAQMKPIINSFNIRPEGLLDRYPRGDVIFIGTIRDILTTDVAQNLKPVLDLLKLANPDQKRGIGVAIGAAVRQCMVQSETASVRKMQDAVRVVNDRMLNAGYQRAFDDLARSPSATQSGSPDQSNPLGRAPVNSPEVSPFRQYQLPDSFKPQQ